MTKSVCDTRRSPGIWLGLALLLIPATLAGQTTQAAIVGVVTDGTGAVLPGVTVTAKSPALQTPEVQAVTDAEGQYRLSPLPIGTYTVLYELPGFQPVLREGVRLSVGFTATLNQALNLSSVAETIMVSGASPLVDVTNAATAVELSLEALEVLPTTRDGLKAYVAQVPGVRSNLDVGHSILTDGVQIRYAGQTGQSWQMLDGVVFSTSNPGNVAGAHLDFNVVESSRVQTVGSQAEVPRAGLFIDSVMKSGGNEFHGEGVIYGSGSALEGTNINDELRAAGVTGVQQLRGLWDVGGTLGGRLIRNKLWFFGGVRQQGYNRELLNAFHEDGSPVLIETRQRFRSGKLSWQMTEQNRLSSLVHWMGESQKRGASQFIPVESMQNFYGPVYLYKLEWQNVRRSGLVTQAQWGGFAKHTYYDPLAEIDNTGPPKVATIDLATQYVTGDWHNGGRDERYVGHHGKTSALWYTSALPGGSHQFKTGVDVWFNRFPHHQRNLRAGNYRLRFQNGTPFEIETFNYPVYPENNQTYVSFYLQDTWQITSRLTFSPGLRFAHEQDYAPEQCHDGGTFAEAQCWDRVELSTWNSVVPRLHFALDVFGDGKSVLKGGWGRFVRMRTLNPEMAMANRNNRQTTTWVWRDLNGNRDYDPGEVNLDPNGPDFRSIAGVTNTIPNPDETQPKSDEFALSFERELTQSLSVRTTGIYARNFNLRRLLEIDRPPDVYNIPITNPDPGPDGVVGTGDDPGTSVTYWDYPTSLAGLASSSTMVVNVPGSQIYKTFEVGVTKRMADGWQANVSFAATKHDVPFADLQPLNPNSEIFTANDFWEYTFKLSGAYRFPFDINLAGNYERRQGTPQARQVQFTGGQSVRSIVLNVEPVGSIRLPDTNLVDFRVAKRFSLGRSHSLEARADFFNVFNLNFVTNRNLRSGSNYLLPSAVILPRIVQVGLNYKF
ncbi:MAG: carboxypeptidase regulatory-like domain-containing protein [Vicinamibacterales bacterium]